MMLALYNSPDSCGIIIRYVLERLGLAYEDHVIDRSRREHKVEPFLSLNPQGLMPVLVDDDLVLYETGAILLHLADKYTEFCLFPFIGTQERSNAYKRLFFITNSLHTNLRIYWYAGHYSRTSDAQKQIREMIIERIRINFELIEQDLAGLETDFFGGKAPGILDYYLAHMVRGAALYPIDRQDFDPQWHDMPAIARWAAQLQGRPEIIASCEKEFIPAPALLNPKRPDIDPARLVG